jgi:hypothetical protein
MSARGPTLPGLFDLQVMLQHLQYGDGSRTKAK